MELKYDEQFLQAGLVVWRGASRVLGDGTGDSVWLFELSDAMDVETSFFEQADVAKLTKLQLARWLILSNRAEAAEWRRLSYLTKEHLANRLG